MMEKVENILKPLILQDVKFTIGNKTIKEGKIQVFNTKQFFIRFKIGKGGDYKDWEVPYPYNIIENDGSFIFDYCLSAICPPSELVHFKMKMLDKSKASKLHDSYLVVTSTQPGT